MSLTRVRRGSEQITSTQGSFSFNEFLSSAYGYALTVRFLVIGLEVGSQCRFWFSHGSANTYYQYGGTRDYWMHRVDGTGEPIGVVMPVAPVPATHRWGMSVGAWVTSSGQNQASPVTVDYELFTFNQKLQTRGESDAGYGYFYDDSEPVLASGLITGGDGGVIGNGRVEGSGCEMHVLFQIDKAGTWTTVFDWRLPKDEAYTGTAVTAYVPMSNGTSWRVLAAPVWLQGYTGAPFFYQIFSTVGL